MSQIYFGIDLGTSSSSISYIVESPRTSLSYYVEPETIGFRSPPGASSFRNLKRLPSMVYVEKSKIIPGFQAEAAARSHLAKPFENLFLSVKSDMGTLKIYEDSVHPDLLTPVDITAEIIKALVKEAEKETGISPKKASVVITVPASFTHSQRKDTLKAAEKAGLNITEGDLLDEPIAAFIHAACHQKLDAQVEMTSPKKILLFDLGAGTCDISIFEASFAQDFISSDIGLEIKNLAISNYVKLGGDNIDQHIVQSEILPVFCEKNGIVFDDLSEREKRFLRYKLKPYSKTIKEEICRRLDQSPGEVKGIRQQWAIDPLFLAFSERKTKRTGGATRLKSFMDLIAPFVTDKTEISYRIFDDYMTFSFFGPVFNALRKAKLEPGDIDAFIFNGGSCHNSKIKEAFESFEPFSRARFFDTPDLDLSVTKGAAIHCYFLHRHKKPVVNPIVSSEIGIYTYGIKKEKLVDAGTRLPFPENEDFHVNENFFLPKDNMRNTGISIYSGDGYVIGNLKLDLPPNTQKGDPVSIGIRIDKNKIMSLQAFMKNTPEIKIDFELSSPWTHRVKSPEEKAANEIWKKVTDLKKDKKEVAPDIMINLATKERLAGNIDGALDILQRLENKGNETANFNNLLGLCYSQRSQEEKALIYYRKATELNPNDVVLKANYGSQLMETGRIEEAISVLRQAVDLDPDYFTPYFWLGHVYRKQGDEPAAKREFSRAREILQNLCRLYPQNEIQIGFLRSTNIALADYEEANKARVLLQKVRNERILEGDLENLVAGPESGIWGMEDLFENQEKERN